MSVKEQILALIPLLTNEDDAKALLAKAESRLIVLWRESLRQKLCSEDVECIKVYSSGIRDVRDLTSQRGDSVSQTLEMTFKVDEMQVFIRLHTEHVLDDSYHNTTDISIIDQEEKICDHESYWFLVNDPIDDLLEEINKVFEKNAGSVQKCIALIRSRVAAGDLGF